jgi:ADP-ribose pyrophosphatase YjhB (NUDIX family)
VKRLKVAHPRLELRQPLAYGLQKAPWLAELLRRLYRLGQVRFSAGVVGVIWNTNHEILLVKHVFHPQHPWGLPGGWLRANENPIEALRRELREEAELEIVVEGLLLVANGQHFRHLDIAYLCRPENAVGELSAELLAFRWTALDGLPHEMAPFHQAAIAEAKRQWKFED